jgi:hypothetical protein
MNSMEDCVRNYLLFLKLRVVMELRKREVVSVDEFEKLLTEELRKVCPKHQGDLGSYLFYFLDIIDINGEKVILSKDGEYYVEVIEKLQGTS